MADRQPHVVTDGLLTTGQNPASSTPAAKALPGTLSHHSPFDTSRKLLLPSPPISSLRWSLWVVKNWMDRCTRSSSRSSCGSLLDSSKLINSDQTIFV